ncbi:MAG: helix-turn-helix transcriptional regulator [Candidatus Brocadiia bacterium]
MEEKDKLLISLPEAAAALGVSPASVWRRIADGTFGPSVVRLGGAVRVRAAELEDWTHAGCPSRSRWTWKPGGGA